MKYDWHYLLHQAMEAHKAEMRTVGVAPTLRRLHYALVSDRTAATVAGYENTRAAYQALSSKLTEERNLGRFPDLSDRTRSVEPAAGALALPDVVGSIRYWAHSHTLRRDTALPWKVILVAEKDGVMPLLTSRFDWLARSAVRGYPSTTLVDRLASMEDRKRETVALYVGDYDPTGLDIDRHLADRMPYEVRRVALTADQVAAYALPPLPAKKTDTRTKGMKAKLGMATQVELDALPSTVLLDLVGNAISDLSGIAIGGDGQPDLPDVDDQEREDREELERIALLVEEALAS